MKIVFKIKVDFIIILHYRKYIAKEFYEGIKIILLKNMQIWIVLIALTNNCFEYLVHLRYFWKKTQASNRIFEKLLEN